MRIVCFFIGHDWSEWDMFSYVPKGGTGFATTVDKCSRSCTRCWHKEYKAWSPEEQELLAEMLGYLTANLNGYIGNLFGVTFMETKNKPPTTTQGWKQYFKAELRK